MSEQLIQTTAWVLGDDVNTDLNCSGKYLPGKDEAYIAAHAFEALDPSFVQRFKSGDIIVAGTHFGINSSREQAVHILRRMGVAAIVAPSFGRQFFRNAINNGLLVLECDTRGWPNGSSVRLDLQAHTFEVLSSDASQAPIVRSFRALPDAILAILREGGLIPFLKKYPNWEVPA